MISTLLSAALFAASAHAQAVLTLPPLDAAPRSGVIDGDHSFFVPDAGVHSRFVARADLQRAHAPLVLEELDGDQRQVLAGVWQLDLGASWGWKRLRLAGSAPVILRYTSDDVDDGTTLGDPNLEAKLAVLQGGPDAVGLAVLGGLRIPMGGHRSALGDTGVRGTTALVVDAAPGPLWVGGHAGLVFRPQNASLQLTQDDSLDLRLALGVVINQDSTITVETRTEGALSSPWTEAAASPTELMLSAHHRTDGGMRLRAGLGAGVVEGVGAPAWRFVLGVGHGGGFDALPETADSAGQ